jgi:hypothetical protein
LADEVASILVSLDRDQAQNALFLEERIRSDEIDPGRKPGIVEDNVFKMASSPPHSRGRVASPWQNYGALVEPPKAVVKPVSRTGTVRYTGGRGSGGSNVSHAPSSFFSGAAAWSAPTKFSR